MPHNKKINIKEAQKVINEIAQFGDIIPSIHCWNKGKGQRNYSIQDIRYVLMNGLVNEQPEYDKVHNGWKYKVEGKTIDGDESIVITAILSHRELLIITVFNK